MELIYIDDIEIGNGSFTIGKLYTVSINPFDEKKDHP